MKTGINDADISSVRMRYTNEDGKVFHVDVASAPLPKDTTTIRMNIDNFDEAYRGCKGLLTNRPALITEYKMLRQNFK